NEDLRLTLAEIMANNKEERAARVLLTNLRDTTMNDVVRSRATVLVNYINTRLESAAAMREYEERRQAAGMVDTPATDAPPKIARTAVTPTSEPGSMVTIVRPAENSKGPQVDGFLTLIDCADGMTLHVRFNDKIVQLHNDTPSNIDFVSYVSRF